jgi:acetyl-CoA acetyltransferase
MSNDNIVIAGYSETKVEFRSGRSAYDFAGEVFAQLLENTGVEKDAVDGMSITVPLSECTNPFFAVYMSDALGISPTWLNYGAIGGCSVTGGVARAMAAIRDGQCEIAVVLSGDAPSSNWGANYRAYRPEFQDIIGVQGPPATFGLLMSRYREQYGLDDEALGKIAVTQREHALLNDNTYEKLKKPINVQDYLDSRVIADPLRLLDCVMFCDGANAVMVMSEDKAKSLGIEKTIRPTAYAEVTNFNGNKSCPDITESGFLQVGPKVFEKSGLKPADIDMFHPYDDFIIAVMMQLEQFGFCDIGKGSEYVMATDLSYKGDLPLNTGGGQISAGQPGLAGGGLNLVEATRQLFGEGEARQVDNPKNALVTGIGVIPYGRNWGTSAAMILEI